MYFARVWVILLQNKSKSTCSKAYLFSPNLGSKAIDGEQAWPSQIYRQGLVKLDAGPETPGDAPHSSHSSLVQAVPELALCTGSKTPKKRPCLALHSRPWKSCNVIWTLLCPLGVQICKSQGLLAGPEFKEVVLLDTGLWYLAEMQSLTPGLHRCCSIWRKDNAG